MKINVLLIMSIEIIAIGTEVLSGFTINTNAAFISKELLKAGWRVSRHTALPDEPTLLRQGIIDALQRNQLVITTGGLGPTCDDISRQVVAEIFRSEFHYDTAIAADLQKRYGPNFSTIKDQATVPSKALILENHIGTAPGFIFSEKNATLIMLPGVPTEMREMWHQHALPYIKRLFLPQKRMYTKHINVFSTSEADVDAVLRELALKNSEIEFGIYTGQGVLSVHVSTFSESEMAASKQLDPILNSVANHFPTVIFESESGKLEESIHQRFVSKKISLSAAESCTGGALSARLTAIPGASKYFFGSIVAYSNDLKSELLNVPKDLLEKYGAVSEEVAVAMLQGLFLKTKSDYGIAVTGIAGPSGGTPDKPVGTVWCAIGHRNDKPIVWRFHARGNREMIIERSINSILGKLLQLTK